MRDSGIQDNACSFGNLFPTEKEEKEKETSENKPRIYIRVGKEEKEKNQKIGTKAVTTAACKITGCTFQILISSSLSLEFQWTSPLAEPANALKIANIGKKEIATLPAEYIAGTILSLLSYRNLIVGKRPAVETNRILVCKYSATELVELLVKVRQITEREIRKELPQFSVDSLPEGSFNQYLIDLSMVIWPIFIKKENGEDNKAVVIRTKARKAAEALFDLSDEDEISSQTGPEKTDHAAALLLWLKERKSK